MIRHFLVCVKWITNKTVQHIKTRSVKNILACPNIMLEYFFIVIISFWFSISAWIDKKMHEFVIGETFSSYEELHTKLNLFKEEHMTEMYTASSRTYQSALNLQKISKKKNFNEALKYTEITFKCIEGGKRDSKSKGQRNTRYKLQIMNYLILCCS